LLEKYTRQFDMPTWVSADRCVLYIMSGKTSEYDLFVATRGM